MQYDPNHDKYQPKEEEEFIQNMSLPNSLQTILIFV